MRAAVELLAAYLIMEPATWPTWGGLPAPLPLWELPTRHPPTRADFSPLCFELAPQSCEPSPSPPTPYFQDGLREGRGRQGKEQAWTGARAPCSQQGRGSGWLARSTESLGDPPRDRLSCCLSDISRVPAPQAAPGLATHTHTHTPAPRPHPLPSGLSFWKAQRHLLCHGDRAISRPGRRLLRAGGGGRGLQGRQYWDRRGEAQGGHSTWGEAPPPPLTSVANSGGLEMALWGERGWTDTCPLVPG